MFPQNNNNQPNGFSLFPNQPQPQSQPASSSSQPFSPSVRPSTDLPTLPTDTALGIQPTAALPPSTHPFSSASSVYSHDEDQIYTSNEPLPPLAEALTRSLTSAEMPLPPPPLATTFSPSEAAAVVAAARSSIAKGPLPSEDANNGGTITSIFPTYNHEIPLSQQQYFPTQTSPTRIPRGVISRPLYEPSPDDIPDSPAHSVHDVTVSQQMPVPIDNEILAGPYAAGTSNAHGPSGARPTLAKPSSIESIKSLWKVANGWKASANEGRVFTLAMAQEPEMPVYTLSSTAQPFYQLKLDPTSTSAHVTLSRLDPVKAVKAANHASLLPRRDGIPAIPEANAPGTGKNWHVAISTVLEEEARLHRPNDGLVALLYPSAARQMALDKSHDAAAVQMSENEAARLIWDDDTGCHYLVHPALAAPFRVAIERTPAWSRTEYTLEHHESPTHLAKLTRDGTGAGTLQVDTGLAARIESFFIIDVAVAALLLVAHRDGKNVPVMAEAFFEPPPASGTSVAAPPPAKLRTALRSVESLDSAGSSGRQPGAEGLVGSLKRMADKKRRKREMEMRKNGGVITTVGKDYEMDLESADSSYITKPKAGSGGGSVADDLDAFAEKLPWPLRIIVWFLTTILKCIMWIFVILVKFLMLIGKGVAKCVGVR